MLQHTQMAQVQEKKKICLFTRNALVLNLHVQYGVDPSELAEMFHIKKPQIQSIIKGIKFPCSGDRALQKERFKANSMKAKIIRIFQGFIDKNTQLITSTLVFKNISDNLYINVPPRKVVQIMKEDLGLKWQQMSQLQYINTRANTALRAHYAWALLTILQENKIIINFDDSQVYEATGRSMSSVNPKHKTGCNYRRDISWLTLHLAITSNDGICFQFLQGNNNDTSMAACCIGLSQGLSTTKVPSRVITRSY